MARYSSITDRNLTKGFQEVYYYANEVTESWLSNMILIGIFSIVWVWVYSVRKDFAESFSIAGFATFVMAVLFWFAEFISGVTLLFVIGIAIFGFILLWLGKKSS